MLCRKCKTKLEDLPQGFDAFMVFNQTKPMYCNNKDCEVFGWVTVAGIVDKDEVPSHQLTQEEKD